MDYSLLIGEIDHSEMRKVKKMVAQDSAIGNCLYYSCDGKAYLLGIIDPLTYFGIGKKAEHKAKMALKGVGVSCIPPDAYAVRFQQQIKEYIKVR